MRIAILGTRGIPNRYGGFEQISETLAGGLVARGHQVTVYCPHHHPCADDVWNGIRRIQCHDPEHLRTFGQFIYDLNCIKHARSEGFDAWLFMGYTSSSVWARWFPKTSAILSNMDGLEWRRSKYAAPVRRFLRYAEKLAVKHSKGHIADSPVIKEWLQERYGIDSRYIPYGAVVREDKNAAALARYGLEPGKYFMVMARMEPENHIDIILEGYARSGTDKHLVVVGNTGNRYGTSLVRRYGKLSGLHFAGAIFDQEIVHQLRAQAALYFHGHSVGGTNPITARSHGQRGADCGTSKPV
jgi:glycosyltransferase involved in cell wall biosynthesis